MFCVCCVEQRKFRLLRSNRSSAFVLANLKEIESNKNSVTWDQFLCSITHWLLPENHEKHRMLTVAFAYDRKSDCNHLRSALVERAEWERGQSRTSFRNRRRFERKRQRHLECEEGRPNWKKRKNAESRRSFRWNPRACWWPIPDSSCRLPECFGPHLDWRLHKWMDGWGLEREMEEDEKHENWWNTQKNESTANLPVTIRNCSMAELCWMSTVAASVSSIVWICEGMRRRVGRWIGWMNHSRGDHRLRCWCRLSKSERRRGGWREEAHTHDGEWISKSLNSVCVCVCVWQVNGESKWLHSSRRWKAERRLFGVAVMCCWTVSDANSSSPCSRMFNRRSSCTPFFTRKTEPSLGDGSQTHSCLTPPPTAGLLESRFFSVYIPTQSAHRQILSHNREKKMKLPRCCLLSDVQLVDWAVGRKTTTTQGLRVRHSKL